MPLPRSLSTNQTFQPLVCKAAYFVNTSKECGFELRSPSWPTLEPGKKKLPLEKALAGFVVCYLQGRLMVGLSLEVVFPIGGLELGELAPLSGVCLWF